MEAHAWIVSEAREKNGFARRRSCHSLPALRATTAAIGRGAPARVNRRAIYTDGEVADWSSNSS